MSPTRFPHEIHDFPRKVLELFAGIGGWRLALSAAAETTPSKSAFAVTAYDSGPHCSEAWKGHLLHCSYGFLKWREDVFDIQKMLLPHFEGVPAPLLQVMVEPPVPCLIHYQISRMRMRMKMLLLLQLCYCCW